MKFSCVRDFGLGVPALLAHIIEAFSLLNSGMGRPAPYQYDETGCVDSQ